MAQDADQSDTPVEEPLLLPQRYDAVHRALLSGLLSNIGKKGDGFEYAGARAMTFTIHPGSGLFKKPPQWVMAAELVQTTRLYARTAGTIQVEWIERLAGHLIKKSWTDPRWQTQSGHVIADERVALYGLVIVPRRTVHYGPIDPKRSREIFIQHALVQGELRTDGAFVLHNRKLIEQVRTLENKARRRDLLADESAQYAFYDARIPGEVYNGPLFERWRRGREAEEPGALRMAMQDLMAPGTGQFITPQRYPDQIVLGALHLPLEYHYEPGSANDGVTVTIPLAALNQVPPARFEWLVPGMLEEKVEALIRALPKALRTHFVPAPQHARQVASQLAFGAGSLVDAVAQQLGKTAGMAIRREAFDLESLADHLRMNFRVIDPGGKVVAGGRDLAAVRRQLGEAAQETFAAMPKTAAYHRDGVRSWDFGDSLPTSVEVRRPGMTLQGYPALVEQDGAVNLRLLDSPEAARVAHRAGVRRLFMIELRREFDDQGRSLAAFGAMALNYATIGSAAELRNDLLSLIADRAFYADQPGDVRTHEEFVRRSEAGWKRLDGAARDVGPVVEQVLALYQPLLRQISAATAPAAWTASVADLRQQLAYLMFRGFLRYTPWDWLRHYPRYLKAAQARWHRLANAGVNRDVQNIAIITPLWKQYLERLASHRSRGISDGQLGLYRWMIEEMRVSLFAQELKTAIPVSPRRLADQWAKVQP